MKGTGKGIRLALAAFFTAYALSGCSLYEFFNGNTNTNTNSGTSAYAVQDQWYPAEGELISDSSYAVTGEDDEMLFETVPSEGFSDEIGLYDSEGNMVSAMNDNGMYGDRVAGDGIYSCMANVRSDSGEPQSYHVEAGDFKTDPLVINYFDEITREDVKQVTELNSMISDSISKYYDKDGFIINKKKKDAYAKVADITKDLYKNDELIDYFCDDRNQTVWMKLNSGISYFYNTPVKDTDSGGDDLNITIKTFQPFRQHYLDHRTGMKDYMKYPDDGATKIDKAYDCASFSSFDNYDNNSVSVNTLLSQFEPDSLIIWHGHGGYNSAIGSELGTGEIFSADKYPSTSALVKDACVVEFNVKDETRVGLTYKYIDMFCGDLSNSFIYLGTCSSLKDTRLCTSFLKKGASAVIGNDNVINTKYNLKMIKSFCEGITQDKQYNAINLKTHFNALDALEYAYDKNGKPKGKDSPGKPMIIGNFDYRIEDAAEEIPTTTAYYMNEINTAKLKIKQTYINVNSGSEETALLSSLPSGYKESDIVWSSEDSSVAKTDKNGKITGVSAGSTVIHAETSDGKYIAYVAVIVKSSD